MTLTKEGQDNITREEVCKNKFICTNCGYIVNPARVTQGSLALEVLLWCFFIVPGIIYSIWRVTSKEMACPVCKSKSLIPTSSPKGQELIKKSKAVIYEAPPKPIWKKIGFWILMWFIGISVIGIVRPIIQELRVKPPIYNNTLGQ